MRKVYLIGVDDGEPPHVRLRELHIGQLYLALSQHGVGVLIASEDGAEQRAVGHVRLVHAEQEPLLEHRVVAFSLDLQKMQEWPSQFISHLGLEISKIGCQ
ncbi:hypothetical protein AVEN_186608-1 [Araneus ventricosus]|uniref:Uncharacterized protein n=1 Tax=Araneus ventricosus TaxID=182803 RepID=A0A4Y2B1Y9_ARAVE|nr:hypothetical protein AVEN_186608-1 [Araneus ventricosus]